MIKRLLLALAVLGVIAGAAAAGSVSAVACDQQQTNPS